MGRAPARGLLGVPGRSGDQAQGISEDAVEGAGEGAVGEGGTLTGTERQTLSSRG